MTARSIRRVAVTVYPLSHCGKTDLHLTRHVSEAADLKPINKAECVENYNNRIVEFSAKDLRAF